MEKVKQHTNKNNMYNIFDHLSDSKPRVICSSNVLEIFKKPTIQTTFKTGFDNSLKPLKKNLLMPHVNESVQKSLIEDVKNMFRHFKKKRLIKLSEVQEKYILPKIKEIPVYTLTNTQNRVVGCFSQELTMTIPTIRDPYPPYNYKKAKLDVYKEKESALLPMGLFFMHKEDALNYLLTVWDLNPSEAFRENLKIDKVGLDVFYKLHRICKNILEVKLIADLKEVELILSKYRRGSSDCKIRIHSNQRWSQNWFQGIPIYRIRKYEDIGEEKSPAILSELTPGKKTLFFSKEKAMKTWDEYIKTISKTQKPPKPYLEIYNLERLLVELEETAIPKLDLIFIPN
nr:hypothetical protein [Cryptomonas borealis]